MKGTSPAELFQSNQGSRAPWFLFWLLVGIAVVAVVVAWWMKRDESDEAPAASGDTPAAEPVAAQAVAPATEEAATKEPAAEEAPSVEAKDEPQEEAVEAEAPAEEEEPSTEETPAEEPAEEETPEAAAPANKAPVEETAEEAQAPAEPDDLTKMEGIGPKISGVLQEKGINTYSQLANTSVDDLKQILTEAKIRIAHPETWPEQAALAAAGDWDDLEKLQDELHGGRRKG